MLERGFYPNAIHVYLRASAAGGYDLLGGFDWTTGLPRGLKNEAENALLSLADAD